MIHARSAFLLAGWLLLTACSGTPLSADNPAAANLSGRWLLDTSASDVLPANLDRHEDPLDARSLRTRRERIIRAALGSGLGFVANDFHVLRAQRIEIELNRDSMGINYDPGTYRDVSWGERQRGLWEVRAGWFEGDVVIESKAEDLFVRERMHRAGNVLTIVVEVDADGEVSSYKRVFNRR